MDVIVIAAFFLTFATMAIHPGAFMFFFMIFLAIGWQGFEPDKLDLIFWERLSGEIVGGLIAMSAIVFLQWWQNRRLR